MRFLLIICACSFGAIGCAVEQVHSDQDRLRHALLDLYTDEIMDNLVRAVNGMPIIHLDYGTAQAQVLAKDSAMVGDSYAKTVSQMLTAAATTTLVTTHMAVNTLTGNASHDNTETIAVTATPLTTSIEAYNAYLQFLALTGSLQSTPTPPPPGAAHICRRYGKVYYWIPVEFKQQFFDLALATTAERGRLLVPPPQFYTVVLQQVVGPKGSEGGVIVQIDKPIPNGAGHVIFSDTRRLNMAPYDPGKGVQLFETNKIDLYLNPAVAPLGIKTIAELKAALDSGPIQVNVDVMDHPPGVPTTNQLLDMIPFRYEPTSWDDSSFSVDISPSDRATVPQARPDAQPTP
jgi:hypothetical protein